MNVGMSPTCGFVVNSNRRWLPIRLQLWQRAQSAVYAHHYFEIIVAARFLLLNTVKKHNYYITNLFKYFDNHLLMSLASLVTLCILFYACKTLS